MSTKTPDEIKKGLGDPVPVHFHRGDPEPHLTPLALRDLEVLHTNALSLIQQLQDQNASLKSLVTAAHAEIADLDTEVEELHARIPRWISVEERLPEHGEIVFCYTKYFYEVLQWDDDAEQWVG